MKESFDGYTISELKDLISEYIGADHVPKNLNVYTDTSDFYRVDYDDIVILGGKPYLIRNNEREGRFGIDEQQKFWVKRARDLTDGSVKIIKFVFHERFEAKVGGIVFECFRSPRKEARILDLTKDHPRFMHGFSVTDASNNIIRIIDFIKGKNFADFVLTLGTDHEDYYYNYLPLILDEFIELTMAINFLHKHGEKHGDIRRDHIIKDSDTKISRWIDFDFNYLHKENFHGYDLFGLGNILVYLAGRGDVTLQSLRQNNSPVVSSLVADDMNIIFNNRVANLKKIYPYIDESLNYIMKHFSLGAEIFYDDTEQFLRDLLEARTNINKT
ncbi:MAG: hypothetical protein HXY52_06970 [Nitrospirae bacterium]|jgi:hypothetical protein|nr:hypothetical protein [Nitrospirota bacterium]